VDCQVCEIQDPITNQVLEIVRQYLNTYQPPIFDSISGCKGISHLITRVAVNTQELMVAIGSNDTVLPDSEALISALKGTPNLKGVYLNHNTNPQFIFLLLPFFKHCIFEIPNSTLDF